MYKLNKIKKIFFCFAVSTLDKIKFLLVTWSTNKEKIIPCKI